MVSKIYLEGLKIYAQHGVLPEENIIGTYYILDIEINVNLSKAIVSDDLCDTVNYAEISTIVHEEMAIPSQLLEHIAGRILGRIHLNYPQIYRTKVKITKTNPPIQGEIRAVSIEIERDNN